MMVLRIGLTHYGVLNKMLDKNITKYINLSDPKYTWGQKSDGSWYCKEFKTDTIDEADENINMINDMLNKYNQKDKTCCKEKK